VGTDFLIDGTKKMENPLAQTGNKLEAFSYCIMGDINAVKNYKSPLDECGYSNLKDTPVFSGIASSVGALNQEDIKNGVLLIDIGAGTTEFVIFHGSGYFDCGVIPVGCDHIANDFAVGLDLHISKAKKLLIDNFKSENLPQSCHIEVKGHFEVRKIPFVSVEKIFNMRVNEIMEIIGTQIKMSNLKRHLGRGVVICGGGANFPLLLKSAEQCFSVPARIGLPIDINGSISEINDPRYTCVSGLLKYGVQKKMQDKNRVKSILSKLDTNLWTGLLKVGRNLRDAIKF
jgi:cell division protein FtsA